MLANGLDLVLEAAGMLPSSLPENLFVFFFSFLFLNAAGTSLNSQAKALFGQTLKDSKDTDRDPVLSLPGVIEDLPQDPHYHLLDFDRISSLEDSSRSTSGKMAGHSVETFRMKMVMNRTKTMDMSIITMMMMIMINTDDKDADVGADVKA